MRNTYVKLFGLISLLFLLTACGNMSIEIKGDGSGKVAIEIPTGGLISEKDIKSQLENEMSEQEGVGKLSVKSRGDNVEASFQFDDISSVDANAFRIPVADYAIVEDSRLDELEIIKDKLEFTEKSTEIFVRLPSDVSDFDKTEVILPGEVVAHSHNVEVTDKSTIEVTSSGAAYVVYEPKASMGGIVWVIVIVIAAAGGFYLYRRRNNAANEPKVEAEKEVDSHA